MDTMDDHMNDTQALPPAVREELDMLARRYRRAGGVGMQVLNVIGVTAENLIERLPESMRGRLDRAAESALTSALRAAHGSRGVVKDQPDWLNSAFTTAMGAAGGFGGWPSALAEIPVTTTILLRVIEGVAAEHGFDTDAENVQFDVLNVFAAAGPLGRGEGADLGFLTARFALSGTTVQAMITRVAPRFATVLGQKLAAQTVPVLGAMAGAATNYAFTSYYNEMAHVHFGLRRLAIEADVPHEALVEGLRERIEKKRVKAA
ncbi:EcsC family protein [Pseudooceanicola sp. LIPI14-2-Ac024]|uniref:EcsC family protein n=1 Tax=Pseudooceanicola sp. LIPI14-2-Ac024 TaxID=3344875 RepID=UPI0035D065C9